jgi:hypothetical protein
MTRIHFIGGEKGGVGKSVVSRVLSQYFIDRQIPFLGFDTDTSHGSLLRFYADFTSPVVIDRYEGLDSIVEAAVAEPERRIVVDLAAQTHGFIVRWMKESELLDADNDLGLSLTYWHVMDSGRDSADLLQALLDQLGGQLEIVVVCNELRGGDFKILESSGTLARARALNASVMTLTRLQETSMQKIDAQNASFWAASQKDAHGHPTLGLLERQRIKHWLRRAYEELDRLAL